MEEGVAERVAAASGAGVPLTILHFNDVYELGSRDKEPVGGAARFASLVKSLASRNPLLFFGGDAFNPSLLSTITKGKVFWIL